MPPRFCFARLALGAFLLVLARTPVAAPTPDEGFSNNYPHAPKESFWQWKWEQLRRGVPDAPPGGWRIPHMKSDAAGLRANTSRPTATWIGHAAFLIQLGGQNILVDPHFSERASPVSFAGPRRFVPLPIDIPDLPRIDVVLTSHNHYDHLGLDTVRRLAAQPAGSPLFLVPLGLKRWFNDQGIERVEELGWWQARDEGGLRYTLVPVQHWSKRTLADANQSLWGGWVMEGGGSSWCTLATWGTRAIRATSASASGPSIWRSSPSDPTHRAGS